VTREPRPGQPENPGDPEDPDGAAEPRDPVDPDGAEGGHFHDARMQLRAAAIEAEIATGRHEEDLRAARTSLIGRLVRGFGGFLLIGVGIALLPLPGPGWVVIIVGLSLLPFAWAERTIVLIRRKVPGVPEEGRIPLGTWIVMGLLLVIATTVSILFGKQIGTWIGDTWSGLWD